MSETEHNRSLPANEKLFDFLKYCKDLPSPPGIALRIIELSQDSVTGIGEIADVVSVDSELTEKILRLANSPLYARQRKIDNLRKAIMLFGLEGTLSIALSISMVAKMRSEESVSLNYAFFWRRSLIAAVACRLIGGRLNLASAVDLFLAGLLQDIGMLALDRAFPKLYKGIGSLQTDHRHVMTVERKSLGTDHAAVGAWLLEHWKLPKRWLQAVTGSHDPLAAGIAAECSPLAQCVAVSSATADIWCCKDHELAIKEAAERAHTLLGIDRENFTSLLMPLISEFREVAAIFDISFEDSSFMKNVLDRTKNILLPQDEQVGKKRNKSQTSRVRLQSRGTEPVEEAHTDELSRMSNRDHFERVLHEEFKSAKDHDWPLTVAFAALDDFEQINETHGHQYSEHIIQSVMRVICAQIRDTDIVSRYGKEWFVILLPGTGCEGAQVVGKRLTNAFRSSCHEISGSVKVIVTVSVGVAVQEGGVKFVKAQDMVRAAARAVYAAKQIGRNRLEFYKAKPTQ